MTILIVGDIHGNFEYLHNLIDQTNPSFTISVGDFGFWYDFLTGQYKHNKCGDFKCPIYFCDGNHENHDLLDELVNYYGYKKPIDVGSNVFYMPRGSCLTLQGQTYMFIGGGYSIDKHVRRPHVDWFEQEELSVKDLMHIDDSIKVDVVVSHTCPNFILKQVCDSIQINYNYVTNKSSEKLLDQIFEIYKPNKWFFGHWHGHKKINYDGCEFTLLNKCDKNLNDWWITL